MGLPPTNSPARRPGRERYHRNPHSNLAAPHNPSLPKQEEFNDPPGTFFSNLRREQHLFTHLLLPGPPPRAHHGHPRPRRVNRTFASPNTSIFRRTRERPATVNANPVPPVHATGLPIKKEAGEILDQRVHVLTSTQELRHSTRKFVKLAGE